MIVSDDRLHRPGQHMVVVVPSTSTVRNLPIHVQVEPDAVSGLDKLTAFQAEQVRAVSARRFVRRLGALQITDRFALDDVLRKVLRLD